MIILPEKWQDWQITEQLGEGSFGVVYEAKKEENGGTKRCAIKVIELPTDDSERSALLSDMSSPQAAEAYLQDLVDKYAGEMTTMYALRDDPHIVRIEDHIIEKTEEELGWRIYIMMELLTSFRDFATGRTFDEKETIRLGEEICDALISCDKHRIIHRDIKPDNIFVTDDDTFKLGDFGAARQLDRSFGSFSAKGTYSYMAPEIFRGEKYNKQVDIYSLGLVLYRMMNRNREPFIDPQKQLVYYIDREQALERRMKGEQLPQPIDASPAFASVILKACSPLAKDRYPDAAAFKADLEKVLETERKDVELTKAGPIRREKARKRKKFLIGAAALALAAAGGLTYYEVQVRPRMAKLITTQGVEEAAKELITSMAEDAGEASFEKFSGYFRNADTGTISQYNSRLTGLQNYEEMYISVLTRLGDEEPETDDGGYIGMDSDDYFVNIIAYTPGQLDDLDYADSTAFVFLISRENGEWKVDLDPDKLAQARQRIREMHIKPEGYEAASDAGRAVIDESGSNYMYLDPSAVFNGMLIRQIKHVWQNEDGSIGYTVWLANGTERAVDFGHAAYTITDIYLGTIAEGEVDIDETVAPGTNILKEFLIPAEDVEPGKEDWTDVTPTLKDIEITGAA